MPTQHTAGDIVWAKLKGYPFWPSRVENDKELSDEVLRSKPPGRSQSVPVLFLGTFDYGWIAPDNLRSFQEHLAQYSKLPKRDKHFEQAIQQALDPDQIEVVLEERRRAADAAEDDEEEEEDEEVEDDNNNEANSNHNEKPGRAGRRRNANEDVEGEEEEEEEEDYQEEEGTSNTNRRGSLAGRRKKAVTPLKRGKEPRGRGQAAKRRRGAVAYSSEEDNNTANATKERKRNSKRGKAAEVEEKLNSDSLNVQPPTTPKPNETTTRTGERPKVTGKFSLKDENPYSRLMYLRHRLQKIVLRENIEPEDLVKCGAIMGDIEVFPVDLALLMETKIGKLMRRITQLNLADDPVDLVGRARGLTQRWRTLLEGAPKSPLSPVTPTAPTTPAVISNSNSVNHTTKMSVDSNQNSTPSRLDIRVTEEEGTTKPVSNSNNNSNNGNGNDSNSNIVDAMDTDVSEPKAEPNGVSTANNNGNSKGIATPVDSIVMKEEKISSTIMSNNDNDDQITKDAMDITPITSTTTTNTTIATTKNDEPLADTNMSEAVATSTTTSAMTSVEQITTTASTLVTATTSPSPSPPSSSIENTITVTAVQNESSNMTSTAT